MPCGVALSFIKRKLLKIKIGSFFPVERAFVKYELSKLFDFSSSCLCLYRSPLTEIRHKLSCHDFFRFSRYFATNQLQFEERIKSKNQSYFNSLISKRFGNENGNLNKHIFNFSNVTLTEMEPSCSFESVRFLHSSLSSKQEVNFR